MRRVLPRSPGRSGLSPPGGTEQTLALRSQGEFEIVVPPPFHFVGTIFKPSHFPSSDVTFDGALYWRTLRIQDEAMGFRLRAAGNASRPKVCVNLYAARRLPAALVAAVKSELTFRFDLGTDLRDFERACGRDRLLAPVIERWRGMRVSTGLSLYEFLVVTTVLQNTTVRRSVQMLEALFRRLGWAALFDGQRLNGFWNPRQLAAMDEQELRQLKLGYRARILKRQAERIGSEPALEQELRQQETDGLRTRLMSLYGVGPASVGYLAFEVFKRHGAFEHASPWEQKIFSRLLFDRALVDPHEILAEAERRWGKWKMLAAHYLFEDLFWHHREKPVPWLAELIRL